MKPASMWFMDDRPELAAEIGWITIRWAALDLLLVQILGEVLRNRVAAQQIIFAEQNAGQQRFRAFERVIGTSSLDAATRKAIIDRMKQIGVLYRKRNEIVHEPFSSRLQVIDGKLHGRIIALDREGKSKDINIDDFKRHATQVDEHLTFLEETALAISLLHEDID
ncbi:hypothetical protein [Shinella zoogloeoides]|uniref:hypothetical protein n=1 Tax=Shinella zoogloeoides TaxID=352475 RepID=UPI00299DAA5B|nr:hypothetical protein [Shinella zoogloeoides]WPE19978.1 hypothetical protein ShzoTeo12_11580 [Shinella zoogloeoides]